MARLTRTQKYAELRGKINQDREQSVATDELSKYAERLKTIENNVLHTPVEEVKEELKAEPVKEEIGDIEISMPSLEPLNIEEPAKEETVSEEEKIRSVEEMIEEMVSGVEKSIRDIKPAEEKIEEKLEEIVNDEAIFSSTIKEEEKEEKEDDLDVFLNTISLDLAKDDVETQEEHTADLDDIFAIFNKVEDKKEETQDDIFSSVEPVKAVEDEIEYEAPAEPVKEENEIVYEAPQEEDIVSQETAENSDVTVEEESDAAAEDVQEAEFTSEEAAENQEEVFEPAEEASESVVEPEETAKESVSAEETAEPVNEETVEENPEDLVKEETVTEEAVKEEEIQETEPAADTEETVKEEVSEPAEDKAEFEPETDNKGIYNEEIDIKLDDIISSIKNNLIEDEADKEEVLEATQENMINDILKEVNEYNQQNQRTDIEDLTSSIIEEVRHPENTPETDKEDEDKDFTDTVTLEIDKVLKEISSMKDTVENKLDDVVIEEVGSLDTTSIEEKLVRQAEYEAENRDVNKGEPVIIKNISETLQMEPSVDSNVLQDTKAFDISATNEIVEEDDEEEENDGAGKVLNIILGILIVVLIAVLAVIVYYILVARGIIG